MEKILIGFGLGLMAGVLISRREAHKVIDQNFERSQQRIVMWRDAVIELAPYAPNDKILGVAEKLQFDSLIISNGLNLEDKDPS